MKRLLSFIIAVTLIISSFACNCIAKRDTGYAEILAEELKELGLFRAVSDTDFDLDRAPSRLEALVMLIRILGDEEGWVEKVECISMELSAPDESGRKSVTPIEGSEFAVDADSVVIAIGQTPNPLIRNTTPDLETNKRGCIIVKEETGEIEKDDD